MRGWKARERHTQTEKQIGRERKSEEMLGHKDRGEMEREEQTGREKIRRDAERGGGEMERGTEREKQILGRENIRREGGDGKRECGVQAAVICHYVL